MSSKESARPEQDKTPPNDTELERLRKIVNDLSGSAWDIRNVLSFMVEALGDDAAGSLPVRCTLIKLRDDADKLATSLMDADWSARHE